MGFDISTDKEKNSYNDNYSLKILTNNVNIKNRIIKILKEEDGVTYIFGFPISNKNRTANKKQGILRGDSITSFFILHSPLNSYCTRTPLLRSNANFLCATIIVAQIDCNVNYRLVTSILKRSR